MERSCEYPTVRAAAGTCQLQSCHQQVCTGQWRPAVQQGRQYGEWQDTDGRCYAEYLDTPRSPGEVDAAMLGEGKHEVPLNKTGQIENKQYEDMSALDYPSQKELAKP